MATTTAEIMSPVEFVPAETAGIRKLFLNVMLTLLVGLSVFAIGTLAFIVPKISAMDLQIASQNNQIISLTNQLQDAQGDVGRLQSNAQFNLSTVEQTPVDTQAGQQGVESRTDTSTPMTP